MDYTIKMDDKYDELQDWLWENIEDPWIDKNGEIQNDPCYLTYNRTDDMSYIEYNEVLNDLVTDMSNYTFDNAIGYFDHFVINEKTISICIGYELKK